MAVADNDVMPRFGSIFVPIDEECIDILIGKLQNPRYKMYEVINFNIYSLNPEQITFYQGFANDLAILGYFFTPRVKKTQTTTTNIPKREAGAGSWYPYTGQTEIRNQNTNVIIGYKQSFRYCEQTVDDNNKKKNGKEIKSKWLMHEYSLNSASSDNFDRFTLNKIFINRRWKNVVFAPECCVACMQYAMMKASLQKQGSVE